MISEEIPQLDETSTSVGEIMRIIVARSAELESTLRRRIEPSGVVAMQSVKVPPVSIFSVYIYLYNNTCQMTPKTSSKLLSPRKTATKTTIPLIIFRNK